MKPLIVSYHTPDDKYTRLAAALMLRLDALGYDYLIPCITGAGALWSQRASFKPNVIMRAMRENPGRDIIWIDVDAEPRFFPREMLDPAFGFVVGSAVRFWFLGNLIKFGGNSELAKAILRTWEYNTPRFPRYTDELLLMHAWHAAVPMFPNEYYAILTKLQVAGVTQLNVSSGFRDPGLYDQADYTQAFKYAVTKRKFDQRFRVDEIIIPR